MAATLDNRYIEVKAQGYVPASSKPAEDNYRYTFDYTYWLAGEDTVTTATASVTTATGAPTVDTPLVEDGVKVTVLVSAGTAGYKGTLRVVAHTQGGQQKSQLLVLSVPATPA